MRLKNVLLYKKKKHIKIKNVTSVVRLGQLYILYTCSCPATVNQSFDNIIIPRPRRRRWRCVKEIRARAFNLTVINRLILFINLIRKSCTIVYFKGINYLRLPIPTTRHPMARSKHIIILYVAAAAIHKIIIIIILNVSCMVPRCTDVVQLKTTVSRYRFPMEIIRRINLNFIHAYRFR